MSDKTTATHHQYYKYGSGSEEWVSYSYDKPWFWENTESLPYSTNFHASWETAFPSKEILAKGRLSHFIQHATPITKEEYERLLKKKADIQAEDDRLEYMWDSNPWSYMDDDD